jgi:hypothetical protein
LTTHVGRPIDPRNLNRSWYVIRERAALGPVRVHDLRICAAGLDTAKDLTGARSVSAVMHGRLEAAGAGRATRGQSVTWAERVSEVGRPEVRALGQRLAEAMDARVTELAAPRLPARSPGSSTRWVRTRRTDRTR